MIGHQQPQQQQYPLASYTMRKSRQLPLPLPLQLHQSQQQQQQQQHIYAQTISRASNLQPLNYLRSLNLNQQQQQQQQIYGVSLPGESAPQQFYYEPGVSLSSQERSLILEQQKQHKKQQQDLLMGTIEQQALLNRPLCRCRVMYLGSSVPHITKNGLHGIQEPLKHLYPEEQFSALPAAKSQVGEPGAINGGASTTTTIDISHLSSSLGIDSWLSVWSNGLLLENVDEFGRDVKRFFSIESLHYCAAVRFFDTTTLMPPGAQPSPALVSGQEDSIQHQQQDLNNNSLGAIVGTKDPAIALSSEPADELARRQRQRKSAVRFLPLDAPLFQCPGMLDAKHPPVFASILRRTTGIKVLECHAFICRRDAAANALVRCCTHAYADFLSARRLSLELGFRGRNCPTSAGGGGLGDRRRSRSQGRHSGHHSTSARRQTSPVYAETADVQQHRRPQYSSGADSTGVSQELDNRSSLETADGEPLGAGDLSSEDNYAIISRHHQPARRGNGGGKSSGSDEERRRAKVGSSRSLFTDFMPQVIGDSTETAAASGRRRSGNHSNVVQMEKLSHSMDLLGLGATCCQDDGGSDGAQYAVVRNKRHSRSMQNLDGPFEFSASAARSSSRRRNHRRNPKAEHCGEQQNRRSASYQDMRRRESVGSEARLSRHAHAPRVPDSSAGNSELSALPPTQSVRRYSNTGPQQYQQPDERDSRRRKSGSGGKRREVTGSGSTASRSRRHDRQRLLDQRLSQQPAPTASQMNTCCAPPPAPHHLLHFPAPPLPHPSQQPVYLPCYLPYAGQHQQPIYASAGGSIYESLIARGAYLAAPAALVPQLQPQQPPYATAGRKSGHKSSSKQHQQRSSSLARFRCLSPPVNFLGGKAPLPPSAERRQQQQQQAAVEPTTIEPAQVEPSQVVTAEPGFISSAASVREKSKMSWIKRLSLTMSSSSATTTNYDSDQPQLNLSTAPDGCPTSAAAQLASSQQQPKRRSSLFSGSLTLGRKASKQQQQQPSLASVVASRS